MSGFRIGGVAIDSPFVLAPLAGVSDSPFRQLAREQGASAVYTEMVSSDGLVRGSRNTLDYCAFESMERILAATPARLINADVRYAALQNRFVRPRRGGRKGNGLRWITIHRHYPRGEIGGMLGLLDFERGRMAGLIERGFREAVEHDCDKNQCVVRGSKA